MTLASLVLVIIRDIRGQILQSRMTRIMGTENFRLPLTRSCWANSTAGVWENQPHNAKAN